MTTLKNSTALARPSIFSALVGPRILLAPDDGGGNGGGNGGAAAGAGGGGAAGAGDAGGAGGGGAAGDAGGNGAGAGGDKGEEGKPPADASLLSQVASGELGKGDKSPDPAGEGDKSGDGEKKEDKPAAEDAPKDVDGKPIPEKYEIKMPDGVEMDTAMLDAVTPLFREAKFSPAQAQAAADIYMQQQTKALEAHSKQVADWANEARSDKEIGGAKFAENMALARKAFEAFGSERAVQIFDTYGLGNNPEILRMFVRIGKASGEGGTILGGDGGGRVSAAHDMYPSMRNGS